MYKVEIVKFLTAKVYRQAGIFTQEVDKDAADAITEFVNQQELGIRIAWDMWKIRDHHCMTIFMLKVNDQSVIE